MAVLLGRHDHHRTHSPGRPHHPRNRVDPIRRARWRDPRRGLARRTRRRRTEDQPRGTRLIIRKERPHPGTRLRFTDTDGRRPTCFATNTTSTAITTLELLAWMPMLALTGRVRGRRGPGLRGPTSWRAAVSGCHESLPERAWGQDHMPVRCSVGSQPSASSAARGPGTVAAARFSRATSRGSPRRAGAYGTRTSEGGMHLRRLEGIGSRRPVRDLSRQVVSVFGWDPPSAASAGSPMANEAVGPSTTRASFTSRLSRERVVSSRDESSPIAAVMSLRDSDA